MTNALMRVNIVTSTITVAAIIAIQVIVVAAAAVTSMILTIMMSLGHKHNDDGKVNNTIEVERLDDDSSSNSNIS
jgi:hypothetical protein